MRLALVLTVHGITSLCFFACRNSQNDVPTTATKKESEKPAQDPTVEDHKAKAEKSAQVAQAQVETHFKQWLEAQNRGSFENYKKLYASRFTGTKRAGRRVRHYNREGWLQDRARMFQKPMQVLADEKTLVVNEMDARLQFVQTWSSGTFKDRGSKEILWHRESESSPWQIVREEMLSSSIVDNTPASDNELKFWQRYRVLPVLATSPGILVSSILAGPQDPPPNGPPKYWSHDPAIASLVAKDKSAFQNTLKIESHGTVLDAMASVCAAPIGDSLHVTSYIPHFGTVSQWEESLAHNPGHAVNIAQEIWDMGSTRSHLAAILSGDCKDPRWWFAGADANPKLISANEVPEPEKPKILDVLRTSPGAKAIQKDYQEIYEENGDWLRRADVHFEFRYFRIPATLSEFVFLSASAGEGCGDFAGLAWILARKSSPAGKWTRLAFGNGDPIFDLPNIDIATDLDADEWPEFLSLNVNDGFILARIDGQYVAKDLLDIPSYDCPC